MFNGFVWSNTIGFSIFKCIITAAPSINNIKFTYTNTRKFKAGTQLVVVGIKKI
jgi:hypothetical protein